jgi:hypothetical protein
VQEPAGVEAVAAVDDDDDDNNDDETRQVGIVGVGLNEELTLDIVEEVTVELELEISVLLD